MFHFEPEFIIRHAAEKHKKFINFAQKKEGAHMAAPDKETLYAVKTTGLSGGLDSYPG